MKIKIQIKSYFNEVLFEYETENNTIKKTVEKAVKQNIYLHGACLQGAFLPFACLRNGDFQGACFRGADLHFADFRGANLRGADFRGANLQCIDFRGADFTGADFRGADVEGIRFKESLFLSDLYSLKLLPKDTKLRFWKYLVNGKSPYCNFKYEVGKVYRFNKYDEDETNLCSYGGNVATLMWCLKNNLEANEFLEVEFKVSDIVAIPYATDGKFRVKEFKVVKKYTRKQVLNLLKK